MCTISDTKVTTAIIIADRPSTRKPTSIFRSPRTIHSYTVPLKRAPSMATHFSTIADTMNDTSTPRMATLCAPRRPIALPKKPAMTAPASGAIGIQSSVEAVSCGAAMSALELVELVDRDRRAVAEQHDEDREADRRFGGRHGEDEEDEHLALHVAQVVRKGHEVEVHREQHQLDAHEQDDQVLAVEEDADHRQREQHRAQRQVVAEDERTDHFWSPWAAAAGCGGSSTVGGMRTMRTRPAFFAFTCSDGSMYFESLRRRNVGAMAAMMATSSSTAAICGGYRYRWLISM